MWQLVDKFSKIFAAPEFINPYLHFFATQQEMQLVIALGRDRLTEEDIAVRLKEPSEVTRELLRKAYKRCVINKETKDGAVYYYASDFYDRLNDFCLSGNYSVINAKVRRQLDEWCFEEYLRQNDYFRKVTGNDPEYSHCHNEWVLLLAEVEAMIDAASAIRLLPCDCKMLADNCDYSREICLILDKKLISDRTGGRDITTEEAKQLVRQLDREGLMHTGGPPDWQQAGPGVVCNCCGCCCYPFRAAKLLGTKGKWPKARYLAEYDRERCLLCGLCVRRCHFGAFSLEKAEDHADGKRKNVFFEPSLCWGCGICASTCPNQAIRLVEIS